MDRLSNQVRKMITSKQLKVSMTEVSRVTGVSTSQLRYWEKKGYIRSEQDEQNKNHYFNLTTIFQAFTIKLFLDQGYTLATAVKKEQERRELHRIFERFITDCILEIRQTGEKKGEVNLGPLADDPTKEVYALIDDHSTSLHLRSVNKE
ncbi:MerR family transcriptional regulator [Limosilactobacillus sp. STM2_1]|uniref:MerR family transcriptional regulator n=1 Tax=Limosilactobacillus rudii TaxID=2759755 RepID=A0A7W3YNV6_9LACO|nr:MerR family transcriptional regulator [Limosilactobacillus rudii]MBB1079664.1 MerR family transcriptional regulator [Limosilactobacillus rudii]MBB1097876.1 MerR family transcriptional regulator [Limosilactobacillus rudii]MCD7134957.1 MerR family transcriptional regulator [Limosilactobacillus rudii]